MLPSNDTTSARSLAILAMTPADIERFWSKVDRSGGPDACWPWMAAHFNYGYGLFNIKGVPHQASRVAYILTHGQILAPGIFVCHHCDNPSCCNPACLWAGTHADNMRDAMRKGRGRSKLTEDNILAIWREYAAGATKADLARKFGVNQTTVGRLVRRKSWITLIPPL